MKKQMTIGMLAIAGLTLLLFRRRKRAKPLMAHYNVNINMTRGGLQRLTEDKRRAEAKREVKMLLVRGQATRGYTDNEVPDFLGTEEAVTRFLEIEPPIAVVPPEFQEIVEAIEDAYVTGNFFAAISASCVSIERVLNMARIQLHEHHKKIKQLWRKGPSNAWDENIDALHTWGYVDGTFAKELKAIYADIRNRYLHSGPITNMPDDARRSVTAAYKLLTIFLGFPADLFRFTTGIECLNTNDPRFIEFYKPNIVNH